MVGLFDAFPYLEGNSLVIKKMVEGDVEALAEITESDRVYKYTPPLLYKKSRGNLLAAIRNCGGRDFDNGKHIIAGVYKKDEPQRLIGLAEMFDYKKRTNQVTIGYCLNERYWHQGIATEVIAMLKAYLIDEVRLNKLYAYVMPENIYSSKALLKNGFVRQPEPATGKNWGGQETVELGVYIFLPRT